MKVPPEQVDWIKTEFRQGNHATIQSSDRQTWPDASPASAGAASLSVIHVRKFQLLRNSYGNGFQWKSPCGANAPSVPKRRRYSACRDAVNASRASRIGRENAGKVPARRPVGLSPISACGGKDQFIWTTQAPRSM